ncbi:MAG: exodeoxyribonuclease VII large subunit [Epsilonproteobacteria bacterium]|nr:exodeoxyribonuclease VII large subunit [Campylobacterota bacterium]
MRLSVTQLNNQIKATIENHFELVEVEGEISQVTYHNTGHIYFSIKDDNSLLNCAMWRSNTKNLKFRLEQGMRIVIYGALSVYTPRGEYKLIASKITPSGVGDLQMAFEQLKSELQQKGYFNKNAPLPKYPTNVAIITANPSAALSDMLKIARKRWPLVKFYIYNTLVQGTQAQYEIANKIRLADSNNHEVIVIARGGGSLEDLWSFNTLSVAEAIYHAKTPIISAIGHEADVLISDYVADKRASTPSNAMEILLPDINEHLFMIDDMIEQFNYKMANILQNKELVLQNLWKLYKLNSISTQFQIKFETLATLKVNFHTKMQNILSQKQLLLPNPSAFNQKMDNILLSKRLLLDKLRLFDDQLENILTKKSSQLEQLQNAYRLANPQNREKFGFVEITKDNTKVDITTLKKGDKAQISNTKAKVDVEVI